MSSPAFTVVTVGLEMESTPEGLYHADRTRMAIAEAERQCPVLRSVHERMELDLLYGEHGQPNPNPPRGIPNARHG